MSLRLSCILLTGLLAVACQEASKLQLQPIEGRVDLSKAIRGAWKRVCVIGPYADNERASAIVGFAIDVESRSHIEKSDNIVLLAAIDGDHSARLLTVERGNVDFAPLSGECYPREQPEFHVDRDGRVSGRGENETPAETVYVCDKSELDGTCIEFQMGEMFSSAAEIQSHCSRLGFGGRQPLFRTAARCPTKNRVGRCVDARGLSEDGKIYGTVHYYHSLSDRWNWEIEGFSWACRTLGGQVSTQPGPLIRK